MDIVLCRHGETEWTLSGQHTSVSDIPLTKKGEIQAQELKPKLSGYAFYAAYASPMQRALKTANLAGFTSPIIDMRASEWKYGDYEGLTSAQIHKKNPDWNLFFDGAPNGEHPGDVGKRADSLIEEWEEQKQNVILFSHGHFLRVLASRWIGLSPSDARLFGLSVASISILSHERGQKIIHLWNRE